jgi:hypothetical protein
MTIRSQALKGSDAAISCIGPKKKFRADAIVSTGAKNVVEAGEKLRVGRYVMQGGILSSVDDLSFANRIIVRMLRVIFSKAVIEF